MAGPTQREEVLGNRARGEFLHGGRRPRRDAGADFDEAIRLEGRRAHGGAAALFSPGPVDQEPVGSIAVAEGVAGRGPGDAAGKAWDRHELRFRRESEQGRPASAQEEKITTVDITPSMPGPCRP